MTFFDDELINIAAADGVVSPTAATIDVVGGSRAARAILQNTHATAVVFYRFETDPVRSTGAGLRLEPKTSVTIDGYDNIRNLRITSDTNDTDVFLAYAS